MVENVPVGGLLALAAEAAVDLLAGRVLADGHRRDDIGHSAMSRSYSSRLTLVPWGPR